MHRNTTSNPTPFSLRFRSYRRYTCNLPHLDDNSRFFRARRNKIPYFYYCQASLRFLSAVLCRFPDNGNYCQQPLSRRPLSFRCLICSLRRMCMPWLIAPFGFRYFSLSKPDSLFRRNHKHTSISFQNRFRRCMRCFLYSAATCRYRLPDTCMYICLYSGFSILFCLTRHTHNRR